MSHAFTQRPRLSAVAALFAGVLLSGCGPGEDPHSYENVMKGQESAREWLAGQGAKLKEIRYPQGNGWSVNLNGMTITDELLRKVKQLGYITELDLSRSTATDAHLGLIAELGLSSLLLKLDLSNTAVTDAGFEKLTNLPLLLQLNLAGTKVTPEAVARFRQKRLNNPKVPARFKRPKIQLK